MLPDMQVQPVSSRIYWDEQKKATSLNLPPTGLISASWGTKSVKPGPWATYLKRLDFPCAKKDKILKSETLIALNKQPAQRELVVRMQRGYTPGAFHARLSEEKIKVEAALGYVVGTKAEPACSSCRSHLGGPFAHCVVASDCPDMTACTNCHFSGDDGRCTYYIAAHPDEPIEKGPIEEMATELQQVDLEVEKLLSESSQLLEEHNNLRADLQDISILFLTGDTREGTSYVQSAARCCKSMHSLLMSTHDRNSQISKRLSDIQVRLQTEITVERFKHKKTQQKWAKRQKRQHSP
ncbi:hypothetical protein N7466_001828 [Penicillium verhagenii]|uniref:uncharacterized protein n=1 Tax=Penicillium verhagenii TaxID=1562060 RepID=UPI002544E565|nr:uncharacterized protein N7466_001828 [Penicillium verhagenii]KAJ5938694.1 hypothetical protein N7466_001828 [Penicillium verhagenii]